MKPSAGRILYKGQDITTLAPADVLGLVRSFQISTVFPNVRVALQHQHGQSFDYWRSKTLLDRFNNRPLNCLATSH